MSWNYRVCRDQWGALAIYEVYYDDKGKPDGWVGSPASVCGETKTEISSVLSMMNAALKKPILDLDSLILDLDSL